MQQNEILPVSVHFRQSRVHTSAEDLLITLRHLELLWISTTNYVPLLTILGTHLTLLITEQLLFSLSPFPTSSRRITTFFYCDSRDSNRKVKRGRAESPWILSSRLVKLPLHRIQNIHEHVKNYGYGRQIEDDKNMPIYFTHATIALLSL